MGDSIIANGRIRVFAALQLSVSPGQVIFDRGCSNVEFCGYPADRHTVPAPAREYLVAAGREVLDEPFYQGEFLLAYHDAIEGRALIGMMETVHIGQKLHGNDAFAPEPVTRLVF